MTSVSGLAGLATCRSLSTRLFAPGPHTCILPPSLPPPPSGACFPPAGVCTRRSLRRVHRSRLIYGGSFHFRWGLFSPLFFELVILFAGLPHPWTVGRLTSPLTPVYSNDCNNNGYRERSQNTAARTRATPIWAAGVPLGTPSPPQSSGLLTAFTGSVRRRGAGSSPGRGVHWLCGVDGGGAKPLPDVRTPRSERRSPKKTRVSWLASLPSAVLSSPWPAAAESRGRTTEVGVRNGGRAACRPGGHGASFRPYAPRALRPWWLSPQRTPPASVDRVWRARVALRLRRRDRARSRAPSGLCCRSLLAAGPLEFLGPHCPLSLIGRAVL